MSGGRRARVVREALERGAEHHRGGRWAEAARAYAEALAEEPGNVDALALLGGVALRLGRPAEALAVVERAVGLAPGHAVARLNQGRALLALDRPVEAELAFAVALGARPGFPEARLGRARALARAGRVEEGVDEAAAAGGSPEALALHGALLVEIGRPDAAEAPLRGALAARPDDARLHADLGACLLALGRDEAAAEAWRAAAARSPEVPGLTTRRATLARNLGLARLSTGSPDTVGWLREAVRLAPADPAAVLGLADALFQHPEPARGGDRGDLTTELVLVLDADGVDHQRVERAVRHVLAEVPGLAAVLAGAREVDAPLATALAAHPLFARWLTRTIVAAPAWSRLVDALRGRWIADVIAGVPVDLAALIAMATHAWHTEYAAGPDGAAGHHPDDVAALPPTPTHLAAFAMLRPLATWPELDRAALLAPGWEDRPLAPLVRAQLVEPAEEAALATALPSLGALTDATSRAVRVQYEENPYPRLVGVHRRPPGAFVAAARALLRDPTYVAPRRVLVAGGGTGQHPIGVAAGLREPDTRSPTEIVCVDLSRASLGRAARLATAAGMTQLRFVQGDLLALGPDDGLGAFEFVDCVGVLHHLADPVAGGRALVAKLAPGGVLRLGLYSERGRSEIVAARALAAEHGWLPTPDGLRTARAALLALPTDHPAAPVTASVDFYSQSGLRDLVFHPCEHRYTPSQIGALVTTLGLSVVALQHARQDAPRLYRARWPDDADGLDLARWDTLEADHPRIFSGMIHVWCRRGVTES